MRKYYTLTLIFLSSYSLLGQINQTFEKEISKLLVEENTSIILANDTVLIDTLIMHANSALLVQDSLFLVIKHAFIDRGTINGRGTNGFHGDHGKPVSINGKPGGNAGSGAVLNLAINIIELNNLKIDLGGGQGGDGGNGFSNENSIHGNGLDGGNGASGGNGGNGGHLTMVYKCENFIPNFNQSGPHSININLDAGMSGKDGIPGKGSKGGNPVRMYSSVTKSLTTVSSGGTRGENGTKTSYGTKGNVGTMKLTRI